MARLWGRMGALFGDSRWLGHAPESRMPDWAEILGGVTMAGIARALERLEAATPEHPPGAGSFRKLCAEFQPGTFAGGDARPLPDVATLLANATVEGSARAYLDLCRRVNDEGGLTRAELETLPACTGDSGQIVRPRDFCTAMDDEGFVKGKRQPHTERCA